ncbi:flagellar hook protein FlgE [Thorsellia anophelis]|uniref:Flagellar hook protein FlgE n=1 Tax=Thorsellia anophelis DSM 18579 TaxID=1123402 RepID=A0A1H9ZFL2_9GAMM|nr:flagellar hook protein FlgE [Thorsellia anophelis]SES80322.1 flagellar hook protein FlgE [Thorsellia anophelis DSM 18579]
MAFSQALSGLKAASQNLDVIGNNIANSATVGFKAGSMAFADMFAGSKVGVGVRVSNVIQNFNSGGTTTTDRGLDVAISGNGFFRLEASNGTIYYARNGQFLLQPDRSITSTEGYKLTGYPVAGTPPTIQQGANPVPITIPEGIIPASATTKANMQINLTSNSQIPKNSPFSPGDSDSFNWVTSTTVFDSLGNPHNMNLYFVKTADNNWDMYYQDGSIPALPAPGAPIQPSATGPGIPIVFDTNGDIVSIDGASNPPLINMTYEALNGAPSADFEVDFSNSTQQNLAANSVSDNFQNGYAPGEFVGFQINDDGTVEGLYSNQQRQLLAQIVLANFANPEGLQPEGNNVWTETRNSGQSRIGIANTGNFGLLTSGALESSNVDQGLELVNMIVAQRNYQANAQTIKTQDQILGTLVNLR